jgi:hypothetical protein
MRDMVYIIGICVAASLGFAVGKVEGAKEVPPPIEVNLDKQCVAWFFESNLKAAKKRICK